MLNELRDVFPRQRRLGFKCLTTSTCEYSRVFDQADVDVRIKGHKAAMNILEYSSGAVYTEEPVESQHARLNSIGRLFVQRDPRGGRPERQFGEDLRGVPQMSEHLVIRLVFGSVVAALPVRSRPPDLRSGVKRRYKCERPGEQGVKSITHKV